MAERVEGGGQATDFIRDLIDALGEIADSGARASRDFAGVRGDALGLMRVVGDVIDADRDFLDGGGGGAERFGLPLRLVGEGAGHAVEVVDAAVELGCVVANLEEHGAQGSDEAVERVGGLADLVAAVTGS